MTTKFSCGYENVRIRDGLDWEFKHAAEIMDSTAPERGLFSLSMLHSLSLMY